MKFQVDWTVTERINGPGQHDDGAVDGQVSVVASGFVEKEAESAEELRNALKGALKVSFPAVGYGPTYNIDREYDIEVVPA
jgi:hypothetical protein